METDIDGQHKDDESLSPRGHFSGNGEGDDTARFEEGLELRRASSLSLDEDDGALDAATFAATDNDLAVSLTPQYTVFKKLDVINGRTVNLLAKMFNSVVVVSLLFSALVVTLASTVFAEHYAEVPGFIPAISVYVFPPSFAATDAALNFAVFFYSIVLFIVYNVMLFRKAKRAPMNEQVWVVVLLFAVILYVNPYEAGMRLRAFVLQRNYDITSDIPEELVQFFVCVRMVSFSLISLLYIWLCSHSYRRLVQPIVWNDWTFYVPKIAAVLLYDAYKLVIMFKMDITFSDLPFASFIGFIHLYRQVGRWPTRGIVVVVILCLIEIVLAALISRNLLQTGRRLTEADYTKHRTKRLGFRFFAHQHVIFYAAFSITYLFILLGLPSGIQVLALQLPNNGAKGSYFDVQYTPFGLHITILAYATIEAYVNLPADASLAFWRKASAASRRKNHLYPSTAELEPITYRNREPPSYHGHGPLLNKNCFVMQTHISMLNLSWFVYYFGTKKESSISLDLSKAGLRVIEFVTDEETDTKCLVVESPDRIILAFKGTTSTQNMSTDIQMFHMSLDEIVPSRNTDGGREPTETITALTQSSRYRRAKVHQGFADAYKSVSERLVDITSQLYSEKHRPIYLTGHSLGGALATVCSLDISLCLDLPDNMVFVSTFGSPRVGNRQFRELYDEHVPMYWRIVAGGDLVARLPKLGYQHVGKKVVLTASGDLFIDPDALEVTLWHSQPASIVHHRKSCYLLAMRGWCDANAYSPNFWSFPISSDDSKRFQQAFSKSKKLALNSPTSQKSTTDIAGVRAARLQVWANAIDRLDTVSPGRRSSAIASWQHLARPILNIIRAPRENGDILRLALPDSVVVGGD